MKKPLLYLLVSVLIYSCNSGSKAPDISGVKFDLAVKRFDQDFFGVDTMNIEKDLAAVQSKYPDLLPVFMQNVLGLNSADQLRAYYRIYRPIYDSSQKIYKNFTPIREELEKAFRYVKYYMPAYKLPAAIIPVIGPMNSREDLARMTNGDYTPNFIGQGFVGISLQFYLGRDFSLYNDEFFVNNIVPLYRSRRFSKEYIQADVMKLVADDIFPDKSNTKSLIEQMIEKGKQWWLLDKFMPDVPDSIKTGYTKQQLDWCTENEGLIWSYILKNEDLYSINPTTIQTYIGEAPFTQGLPQESSPGNIGQWVGWQIVKKYAGKHSSMKIEELMKTPSQKIVDDAKYKPK